MNGFNDVQMQLIKLMVREGTSKTKNFNPYLEYKDGKLSCPNGGGPMISYQGEENDGSFGVDRTPVI